MTLTIGRSAAGWLHRFARAASSGLQRAQSVCAEVSLAVLNADLERSLANDYSGRDAFFGSAEYQRRGLYPFERRALERFPRPPARLFVPGAGGGRELLPLLEMGYTLDALEPVQSLFEAAKRFVGDRAAVHLTQESLQAWSERDSGPYDGIFTGWSVWTHILRREERLAILRAFRRACPKGPILLSFWRAEDWGDASEAPRASATGAPPAGALQRVSRVWLRERLLGLPPLERGTDWTAGMYVHWVSEAELEEEAAACGLRIQFYERDAVRYPCAILRTAAG